MHSIKRKISYRVMVTPEALLAEHTAPLAFLELLTTVKILSHILGLFLTERLPELIAEDATIKEVSSQTRKQVIGSQKTLLLKEEGRIPVATKGRIIEYLMNFKAFRALFTQCLMAFEQGRLSITSEDLQNTEKLDWEVEQFKDWNKASDYIIKMIGVQQDFRIMIWMVSVVKRQLRAFIDTKTKKTKKKNIELSGVIMAAARPEDKEWHMTMGIASSNGLKTASDIVEWFKKGEGLTTMEAMQIMKNSRDPHVNLQYHYVNALSIDTSQVTLEQLLLNPYRFINKDFYPKASLMVYRMLYNYDLDKLKEKEDLAEQVFFEGNVSKQQLYNLFDWNAEDWQDETEHIRGFIMEKELRFYWKKNEASDNIYDVLAEIGLREKRPEPLPIMEETINEPSQKRDMVANPEEEATPDLIEKREPELTLAVLNTSELVQEERALGKTRDTQDQEPTTNLQENIDHSQLGSERQAEGRPSYNKAPKFLKSKLQPSTPGKGRKIDEKRTGRKRKKKKFKLKTVSPYKIRQDRRPEETPNVKGQDKRRRLYKKKHKKPFEEVELQIQDSESKHIFQYKFRVGFRTYKYKRKYMLAEQQNMMKINVPQLPAEDLEEYQKIFNNVKFLEAKMLEKSETQQNDLKNVGQVLDWAQKSIQNKAAKATADSVRNLVAYLNKEKSWNEITNGEKDVTPEQDQQIRATMVPMINQINKDNDNVISKWVKIERWLQQEGIDQWIMPGGHWKQAAGAMTRLLQASVTLQKKWEGEIQVRKQYAQIIEDYKGPEGEGDICDCKACSLTKLLHWKEEMLKKKEESVQQACELLSQTEGMEGLQLMTKKAEIAAANEKVGYYDEIVGTIDKDIIMTQTQEESEVEEEEEEEEEHGAITPEEEEEQQEEGQLEEEQQSDEEPSDEEEEED